MISLDCPGCGQGSDCSDFLAGLTIICKNCGHRVPVPSAASSPPSPIAAQPAPRGSQPAPPPPPPTPPPAAVQPAASPGITSPPGGRPLEFVAPERVSALRLEEQVLLERPSEDLLVVPDRLGRTIVLTFICIIMLLSACMDVATYFLLPGALRR